MARRPGERLGDRQIAVMLARHDFEIYTDLAKSLNMSVSALVRTSSSICLPMWLEIRKTMAEFSANVAGKFQNAARLTPASEHELQEIFDASSYVQEKQVGAINRIQKKYYGVDEDLPEPEKEDMPEPPEQDLPEPLVDVSDVLPPDVGSQQVTIGKNGIVDYKKDAASLIKSEKKTKKSKKEVEELELNDVIDAVLADDVEPDNINIDSRSDVNDTLFDSDGVLADATPEEKKKLMDETSRIEDPVPEPSDNADHIPIEDLNDLFTTDID